MLVVLASTVHASGYSAGAHRGAHRDIAQNCWQFRVSACGDLPQAMRRHRATETAEPCGADRVRDSPRNRTEFMCADVVDVVEDLHGSCTATPRAPSRRNEVSWPRCSHASFRVAARPLLTPGQWCTRSTGCPSPGSLPSRPACPPSNAVRRIVAARVVDCRRSKPIALNRRLAVTRPTVLACS